jgi:hypothetical protein
VQNQSQLTDKPDPSWIADPEIPVRGGERLGDFYDWSFDLYFWICKDAIKKQAARRYYKMNPDSDAVDQCLEDFTVEELRQSQ